MLSTFANLLKFVFSIKFSLLISFLLLNQFMRFWKKTFHSFKNSLNKKTMNIFKIAFINFFVFTFIDYEIDVVILAINASFEDWKKCWWFCATKRNIQCVMKMKSDQMRKKNTTSSRKNVAKFLKFLKKIRFYFYNVKFILKINVRVLVDQLNRFNINFFDAFITRWLVRIRFFDFEVRHVFNIKHIAANDLFKKSSSFNDFKKVVKKKWWLNEYSARLYACVICLDCKKRILFDFNF
jgi:hypothetical protein